MLMRQTIPKTLARKPTIHQTAVVTDSRLGEWTEIGPNVRITETGIGDYSYVERYSNLIYSQIGRFCSIAAHVRINPGNHPLQRATMHHFTYRSRQYDMAEDDDGFFDWRRSLPVALGHDVWVGHGAVILPGVSIGTGAAIGAGAVVTKDVSPFTIAAGVPARPIRKRFPKMVQDGLLEISWWNWSHPKLSSALMDFRTLDAYEFIEKYKG
jgi:phosphonate metabolism protein (transferase hexapeptide repeat family)